MTTLMPHIAFDSEESVVSYASRLAAAHTGQGVHRLLDDMNISVERFTLGDLDAVARFARIAGTDPNLLLHSNIRAMRTDVVFRGERYHKTFLPRSVDKYCPECLAEDGAPRNWKQRLIWCFAPVHRCPHHGIWLERLGVRARTLLECQELVAAKALHAAIETMPTHLSWLQRRLQGETEEAVWLEGQELQQVLDASLMLGAVLEEGHDVVVKHLPTERREAVTETGFIIYAAGPEAVADALKEIRMRSSATAVQAGPLAYYGKLYEWLDRNCNDRDPGPIRDLLRDQIIEHDAVDVGAVILGKEITRRRFHSVQSLTTTLGINRKRMSRLLQKLGKVPIGATDAEAGLLRFDADEISTLLEDFKTAIPLVDVPEYIGSSLSQMQTLYSAGFLSPLVPRDGPGSVRQVVFACRNLDEFRAQFDALPEIDSEMEDDLHPISYASQRGAGTTIEIVTAIISGSLSAYRRSDGFGLSAVMVSVAEAKRLRAA